MKIRTKMATAVLAFAPILAANLVYARVPIDPNVAQQLTLPRSFNGAGLIAQPVLAQSLSQPRDRGDRSEPNFRPRTTTVPLSETSVLSAFRLGFSNGDHHVKQISVRRSGAQAVGVLADNNGDDNYAFTASWWNIPGSVASEMSGNADFYMGINGIILPEGPAESTLALVGFNLTAPQDAEIWGVRVLLDSATRKVNFVLETTNSARGDIGYTIQYAWVPNTALNGNFTATGSGVEPGARRASQASGTLPPDGRYILRGFDLKYNDSNRSAQNLLGLGVHLAPGPNPAVDREVVTWQDNDRNERIAWRVDYSTLK